MGLRKRHAKRLRAAGGYLLALIVIIFIAEWVARGMQDKFLDPKSNPLIAFHPSTGYILKPYVAMDLENPSGDRVVIDVNSLGLRDREITSKRTREFRIVGLGDTFTAAIPVGAGDTYLRQLEKRIESDSSSGGVYHVINAGIPGYNLEQESRLLLELGQTLDPDLVLLGLYVGDDVRDYGQEVGLPVPGKRFLRNQSYLYHGLRRAYHKIRGGGPKDPVAGPKDTHRWTEIFERYGEKPEEDEIVHYVSVARSEIPVYGVGEASKTAWSATEAVVRGIRDRARLLGANTAVVLVPTQRQVLESEWEKTVEILKIDPGMYDLDHPQKQLVQMAARLEIPVLDLRPVFRSAPNPDSLYWPGQSHWTPAAHALAAEAIYEFLAHEDVLKP